MLYVLQGTFVRHREPLTYKISRNLKVSFSKETNILSETIYMKVKFPSLRILFERIVFKIKS